MQLELITPCGVITAIKNGEKIYFDVCDNLYNTYWINGENGEDKAVHPDGCVEIIIDLLEMKVGDYLVCALDSRAITPDGGGENQLNSTGHYNGNYIGIGAPDTDDLEYAWEECDDNLPKCLNKTRRYLPYNSCHSKEGFEFQIIDDPKLYRDRPLRKAITLPVVWCSSTKDYAYEIVSFLTS
jgi:hypothetical protein